MASPPASSVLVGRDLAPVRRHRPRGKRQFGVVLLGIVLAAFALAALRNDILRLRYGLGEAVSTQKALLEEHRELTAEVRSLRDPARLARLARQRGFGRAERVIDLRSATAGTDRP
ncbi:MAG: hypothetical protein OEM05_00090 [Myxococcales bacterium]|nr:hypothetical protein [Myxococcales bacterium]